MKNTEFDRWFVRTYGAQPHADASLGMLKHKMDLARIRLFNAQYDHRQRIVWEAQRRAALRVWNKKARAR